ncbi:50S ribosomal protein L18 [Petrotoga sp. 9T1HF07.CasAA.8.2]|uniref:50S ribosomal protein L18 n=1 Tax=unclassified Petrotoga TaxID=2620614 RepID=UPI000CC2770E|nr:MULTISPECIES: 50S ribosomal protein L18 [unclassified Petrotoga]MBL5981788.1 50S ribosomal protein L18 [Petrotoga sp. 8T1HF07.NaAc.6.1]MDK2812077.1 large subunit ribosomal protein [Petrotoga sp.]PNR89735.1 50S ribosomal protein L18 [Petrotoga sp. 9T1HF07.CasAA.8.2]
MIKQLDKKALRQKRHLRVRKNVRGTPEKPRLTVFKSQKHIYAQIIDDTKGVTLVSASTTQKQLKEKLEKTWDENAAKEVGKLIAEKAKEKGITEIVFDRSGYKYHGKVKALAEAARETGLKF